MRKADLGIWLESMGFVPEHPFRGRSGTRRWRFDWALPADVADGTYAGVAVEYHGQGAHTHFVEGTWRDHEKATEAGLCGWLLIQCNAMTAREGKCQDWVDAAMAKIREAS